MLIEGFRPGVMERWGLGPDDLLAVNSGLVMLRYSGFGQTGPYKDRPGFGTIAECMSGYVGMTGFQDTPLPYCHLFPWPTRWPASLAQWPE